MPKGQRNAAPVAPPKPVEVIAPAVIAAEPPAIIEAESIAAPEVITWAAAESAEVSASAPETAESIMADGLAAMLAAPTSLPSGPMNGIAHFYAPPVAEDLPTYAKRIEQVAQPLAVCIITHPDAVDGAIFEGVYAGIRLVNGPEISARLSDGSYI